MDLTIPIISLPAIVALIFKAAIYSYTRLVRVARNLETRIFFLFLLALVVQNVAEIVGGYRLNIGNTIPRVEAKVFYVSLIGAISLLFQLSVCMAFDAQHAVRRMLPTYVYLYAAALALLVFTPWLIRDFVALDYGIGYSTTRVPGSLYFLFEFYVLGIFLSVIGILFYGWRKQRSDKKRSKNLVLLVAIVPTAVVMILVIGLLHFGIKWINATVTTPLTITYFLIVSAYGIHHRRFFDIQDGLDELAALRAQVAEERGKSFARKQQHTPDSDPPATTSAPLKPLDVQVAELEARVISEALALYDGNQTKAAARLGLRPNTLHYKMERYGLPSSRKRRR